MIVFWYVCVSLHVVIFLLTKYWMEYLSIYHYILPLGLFFMSMRVFSALFISTLLFSPSFSIMNLFISDFSIPYLVLLSFLFPCVGQCRWLDGCSPLDTHEGMTPIPDWLGKSVLRLDTESRSLSYIWTWKKALIVRMIPWRCVCSKGFFFFFYKTYTVSVCT